MKRLKTTLSQRPSPKLPIKSLCLWCQGLSSQPICELCQPELPKTQRQPHCGRCALPLKSEEDLCGECLSEPPAYHATLSGFYFRDPINHWISSYKDKRNIALLNLLTETLIEDIRSTYDLNTLPDRLIPVPQHWLKTLKRGFNPVDLLAQKLSREFSIPVTRVLKRIQYGPDLRGMNKKQRKKALKGVYELKKSHQATLQGAHIVVVDDVMTTSTTARHISALLKNQGAEQVDIWCLARTEKWR